MPWFLIALHLAVCGAVIVAGNRTGIRQLLLAAAIAPAVATGWAIRRLVVDADPTVHEVLWVEGLDLSIRFRIDSLALLMTVLVSGIGALVFVYATGYFDADAGAGARFTASLLAFSTSMLGLVWADSIWTFFIFWEFTSVTSFLLVGHKNVDPSVQAAARRALMITGAGGLALLAGLLVLADAAGTTVISDLTPVDGGAAAVAAVLVLVGAATKSAQVPFHVWLPGAMAAPTPVSAYLHSATMVKAGVLLVAVSGAAFAETPTFTGLGLTLGVGSILWGAYGALRHHDAKLILAWGTVSQLGLMITLLSVGTGKAVFAAVSILFAHAVFKAALFLVVGEIDVRTGTRDITQLGGLASAMPIATAVAMLAGLSMAGVPPLLGFAAKEAAIEAVLGLEGYERFVASIGVIGGSILTVAYTARLLVGAFGPGPETLVASRRVAMTGPAVILGAGGLVGFVLLGTVSDVVRAAAVELNPAAEPYALLRWPGLKLAFGISMAVLVAGAILAIVVTRLGSQAPQAVGEERADAALDSVLRFARQVTGIVQHGSLPVYLTVMAGTAALATLPFVPALDTDHLVWADQSLQAVLGVAIVAAAAAGAIVGSRLGAALALGAVGTGISGMFVLYGAPDLALTQLLVETIVVVGFVVGLGHLARRFPSTPGTWRTVRLAVAGAGGLAVAFALAAASANPTGQAPVAALTDAAVVDGGGNNIVNVILTDIRALDTLGEVVVLATVAVGILALAAVPRSEVTT